ncbi:MAG: hypothetical protein CMF62_06480 [Magnetococcales bacterium]|jgi:hypothetical protein|nr:hypothetical protein [Magnetococcales bacterium]|tara:strand:+ start:322109 stop:322501 length:393 start_codon:yes stop_codon:yes gene_type:complete
MIMRLKGSCYCGEVTFDVAGPVSWEGHCHCTMCQRLNGAPFSTWCGFKTSDYNIHDPNNHFKTYDYANSRRGFCTNCGSPFFHQYTENAKQYKEHGEEVFFTRTNITTQDKLSNVVQRHVFIETRVPWLK